MAYATRRSTLRRLKGPMAGVWRAFFSGPAKNMEVFPLVFLQSKTKKGHPQQNVRPIASM